MKRLLQIVLASSLSLLCFSCYYDEGVEEIIPDESNKPVGEVISFKVDIQPIFTNNCVACHNGITANPVLEEDDAWDELIPEYVTLGDAENSRLYNYLPGNGHHDIGFTLSSTEIATIKAWIDQGPVEN